MSERVAQLIKNMGYEGISQLTNPVILEIINRLESSPDTQRLANLIVEIYGSVPLLQDTAKRKQLLQYLKKSQAEELCNRLGLKFSDPWEALSKFNLTEERKFEVFDYFEINSNEYEYANISEPNYTFVKEIEPLYSLFDHQETAATEVKKSLKEEKSRVLLHMPTGAGKTRTAMSISCDHIRNQLKDRGSNVVVWLADTEELCDQAANEFERAWSCLGVGKTSLYRMHGSIDVDISVVSSGFVVSSLQKLNSLMDKQLREFYELCAKTGLVIFDEAHKATAPTYRHVIEVFQTAGRASLLGLSATPGRATYDMDENEKFSNFFHKNKVTLHVEGYDNPVNYLQEAGYLSKTNYQSLPYDNSDIKLTKADITKISSVSDIPDSVLNKLGVDVKRNIKILELAISLASQSKQIILFACSVENSEALFFLLKYSGVKCGLVTSTTASALRRDTIEKYKNNEINVLINYGVLTTGFDAPKTNVAIIARPTNSLMLFSQMVGRATRGINSGGNKYSDIYVIKDTLPGLRDMSEAFSHWDDAWE